MDLRGVIMGRKKSSDKRSAVEAGLDPFKLPRLPNEEKEGRTEEDDSPSEDGAIWDDLSDRANLSDVGDSPRKKSNANSRVKSERDNKKKRNNDGSSDGSFLSKEEESKQEDSSSTNHTSGVKRRLKRVMSGREKNKRVSNRKDSTPQVDEVKSQPNLVEKKSVLGTRDRELKKSFLEYKQQLQEEGEDPEKKEKRRSWSVEDKDRKEDILLKDGESLRSASTHESGKRKKLEDPKTRRASNHILKKERNATITPNSANVGNSSVGKSIHPSGRRTENFTVGSTSPNSIKRSNDDLALQDIKRSSFSTARVGAPQTARRDSAGSAAVPALMTEEKDSPSGITFLQAHPTDRLRHHLWGTDKYRKGTISPSTSSATSPPTSTNTDSSASVSPTADSTPTEEREATINTHHNNNNNSSSNMNSSMSSNNLGSSGGAHGKLSYGGFSNSGSIVVGHRSSPNLSPTLGSSRGTLSPAMKENSLSQSHPNHMIQPPPSSSASSSSIAVLSPQSASSLTHEEDRDTGRMIIASGNIDDLIRALCPTQQSVNADYITSFLLTRRYFISRLRLLAKLTEIYTETPRPDASEEVLKQFKRWQIGLQARVIQVIIKWVENYHYDFMDLEDPGLQQELKYTQEREEVSCSSTSSSLITTATTSTEGEGRSEEGVQGQGKGDPVDSSKNEEELEEARESKKKQLRQEMAIVDRQEIQLRLIEFVRLSSAHQFSSRLKATLYTKIKENKITLNYSQLPDSDLLQFIRELEPQKPQSSSELTSRNLTLLESQKESSNSSSNDNLKQLTHSDGSTSSNSSNTTGAQESEDNVASITEINSHVVSDVNWKVIGPRHLAEQITVRELIRFGKITPNELLFGNWKKPNKYELSPNVIAIIDNFNTITSWVATEIVKGKDVKERCRRIKLFIRTAKECFEFKNYHSSKNFVVALKQAVVMKLKESWARVKKADMDVLAELEAVMGQQRNFKRYRDEFTTKHPPHLPYVGVHLQDLLAIEELPTWVEGRMDKGRIVNFKKMQKLEFAARPILSSLQQNYDLTVSNTIQRMLGELEVFNSEELWAHVKECNETG